MDTRDVMFCIFLGVGIVAAWESVLTSRKFRELADLQLSLIATEIKEQEG